MIAMCNQFTYTPEELAAARSEELRRTLSAIKQIRDELIGDWWPAVLDTQRQNITNELTRRAMQAVLVTEVLVENLVTI
jgi:hypothetical protein